MGGEQDTEEGKQKLTNLEIEYKPLGWERRNGTYIDKWRYRHRQYEREEAQCRAGACRHHIAQRRPKGVYQPEFEVGCMCAPRNLYVRLRFITQSWA